MNRKLRVQSACVLALVLLVGWPQFRSIRAITVWRPLGPLTPRPDQVTADPRFIRAQSGGLMRIGYGSLSELREDVTAVTIRRQREATRRRGVWTPSPAVTTVGGRLNAIQCMARTSLNQPIPYARLVLRDTVTGRIEARATADQEGRCRFLDLLPSHYVIELIGPDGSVIASSELVDVGEGELRQALVVLSTDSTVTGVFGSVQTGAAETVNRAVDSGAQGLGQPDETNSPQQ